MFNKKQKNSTKQLQTSAFDKFEANKIKNTASIIGGTGEPYRAPFPVVVIDSGSGSSIDRDGLDDSIVVDSIAA